MGHYRPVTGLLYLYLYLYLLNVQIKFGNFLFLIGVSGEGNRVMISNYLGGNTIHVYIQPICPSIIVWFNLRTERNNILEASRRLLFVSPSSVTVLNLRDNKRDFIQVETKRQLGVTRELQDLAECTTEATQDAGTEKRVREHSGT